MYINSGLLRATDVVGHSFKFKGKGSIYGEISVTKIELVYDRFGREHHSNAKIVPQIHTTEYKISTKKLKEAHF